MRQNLLAKKKELLRIQQMKAEVEMEEARLKIIEQEAKVQKKVFNRAKVKVV